MEKDVNFVYQSSENLRSFEREMAKDIFSCLKDYDFYETVVKTKKNAVNMTFFIHRRSHIMMSHGLADKNYLVRQDPSGGLEINKYNYVCVPGLWLKNKILNHPANELKDQQIKLVGWPRLDMLIKNNVKHEGGKKTKVLWAPTHTGGNADGINVSSYPALKSYLNLIGERYELAVSLHPNINKSGKTTFQELIDCDVVISDQGTLVYEAWLLGKPVIFPSWLVKQGIMEKYPGSAESLIYKNNIGLHASSVEHMIFLIDSQQGNGSDVDAFLKEYFDYSSIGRSNKIIANLIEDVWQKGDLKIKPKVV